MRAGNVTESLTCGLRIKYVGEIIAMCTRYDGRHRVTADDVTESLTCRLRVLQFHVQLSNIGHLEEFLHVPEEWCADEVLARTDPDSGFLDLIQSYHIRLWIVHDVRVLLFY